MCELFAMSSRLPATVNLSLATLARHGGVTAPHKDGWGIGYYVDGDVLLIREPAAAGRSDWVRFIAARDLRSRLVISHIRQASAGAPALRNTHPFRRELGGRTHLFAHNGHLPGIRVADGLRLGRHRPVGDTDSEYAFCVLLARLEALWLSADAVPALAARLDIVTAFAAALRPLGPANFLYADGETLFAHGHRRRHRDGTFRAPGLCMLTRQCPAQDPVFRSAAGVTVTPSDQKVVLFASVPLSDEAWRPLGEGEVMAVPDPDAVVRLAP